MRKHLASPLSSLKARYQPLESRVEEWRTISLQLGSWYDREYKEGDVV
jgi:hypothetical protein